MFASQVKKTIPVGDVEVTIRKLSARSLEKAEEQRQISMGAAAKNLGPEILKALRSEDRGSKSPEAKAEARYDSFDRHSVLIAGVMSWTSDVDVAKGVEDLDQESADAIFRAILDLSLPPAPEVQKAAEGKD